MERSRILISGASSGLGLQMAREFAGIGRSLALCARRLDRLESLRDELRAGAGTRSRTGSRTGTTAPTIEAYPLDVTDTDAVFDVVRRARADLGGLDRVIVNAGSGGGRPVGTGAHAVNLRTARTNFLGALAQCEAALEVFREQGHGHVVLVSSVSALRGLPRNATTYAATKAGLAHYGAGLQVELAGSGIVVSTILPGYIRTEMTQGLRAPGIVNLERGARAVVAAIEREPARAVVPGWPWRPLGTLIRLAPRPVLDRIT